MSLACQSLKFLYIENKLTAVFKDSFFFKSPECLDKSFDTIMPPLVVFSQHTELLSPFVLQC